MELLVDTSRLQQIAELSFGRARGAARPLVLRQLNAGASGIATTS